MGEIGSEREKESPGTPNDVEQRKSVNRPIKISIPLKSVGTTRVFSSWMGWHLRSPCLDVKRKGDLKNLEKLMSLELQEFHTLGFVFVTDVGSGYLY